MGYLKIAKWSSLVVQWVKDPAGSLQQLRLPLWCGFDPWPRNFHMPWAWFKLNKIKVAKNKS